MIQPRPYQTEALNSVLAEWKHGTNRQLVSLPTGCGKTIIFGLVANALKTKTLVLAHREELLTQAEQKIHLCKFGELIGKELQPTKSKAKPQEIADRYEEPGYDFDDVGAAFSTPHVQQLELLAQSSFVWQTQGVDYTLPLVDGSALFCLHVEGETDAYTALYMPQNGATQKISDGVLPLGYAMGSCEDFARRLSLGNLSLKDAAWRTKPATPKQIATIGRMGVDVKPGLTKGEASALITATQSTPATDKQKWFIARYRLHPTPELLTKAQASKIIGKYKQQKAS